MARRRELARAFKRAQDALWDGRDGGRGFYSHEYICHAISHTSNYEVAAAAKKIVMDRIAPHGSLDVWLIDVAKVLTHRQVDTKRIKIQAHRLAWLKQLEKEFSGE